MRQKGRIFCSLLVWSLTSPKLLDLARRNAHQSKAYQIEMQLAVQSLTFTRALHLKIRVKEAKWP